MTDEIICPECGEKYDELPDGCILICCGKIIQHYDILAERRTEKAAGKAIRIEGEV